MPVLKINRNTFKNRRPIVIAIIVVAFAILGYIAITLSGAQQLNTNQDEATRADAVTPNDPLFADQYMIKTTKVDELWERTKGSPDVVAAVISTGVKSDHPDLQGKLTKSYDFVNKNNDASPDHHGDGTANAGIIAASTNNGAGIAGICWECKVMPLDIVDEDNNNAYPAQRMSDAIDYAVQNGAKVIAITYGYKSVQPPVASAVKRAYDKGVLIVSFNYSDSTDDHLAYPAHVPEVISVAGTDASDKLRPTSNFGPKVELAAPGALIKTASTKDTIYSDWSGNGVAVGVVTGIASLLYSLYPKATPAQMTQALVSTADTCCDGKIGGGGRVNAIKAADYLEKLYPTTPAPKAGDLNGDGKVNISDLSALLSKWNSADAKADLNKDGKVGLTDLSMLLSGWTR